MENDGSMGTITPHREMKLLAVEECARGTEQMPLIEDAEVVEHNIQRRGRTARTDYQCAYRTGHDRII